MSGAATGNRTACRVGPIAGLVAALCFQAATFQRLLGFERLWSSSPVVTDDYAYHYANARTVSEFLRRGRWWGYDPFLYAGYPAGALLSVDNRALEVSVAVALAAGGGDTAAARVQKLELLGYWLLVPVLGWAASRAFGFGRWVSGAHAILAVIFAECSLTGPMVRLFGMISFAWATLLAPWVAGLWYALLRRWTLPRLLGLAAAAQLLCLVHGLGPLLAAAPVLLAAAQRARGLDRRQGLELAAVIALLVLANLGWLWPALHFRDHLVEGGMSAQMLQAGGPGDLVRILVLGGNPLSILHYYPAFRPTLAALALLGAVLGWRSPHRDAVVVCCTGAGALLLLAFGAGHLASVRELQPIRFLPAALAWLLALAAFGLVDGFRRLARWSAASAGALALLVGLAGWTTGAEFLARTLGDRADTLRVGLPREILQVSTLVRRHTTRAARVLVEDSGGLSQHQYGGTHATGMLPHLVAREYVLGPAPYVPLIEDQIALTEGNLGGRPIDRIAGDELARYFDRYNVGWIVAWSDPVKRLFDGAASVRRISKRGKFVLYAVEREHSYFLAGRGRVRAGYDRLVLEALEPGSTVVLAYHYLDTLEADAGSAIHRNREFGDPIGFIEIRDVPERLVIRNRGLLGRGLAE